MTLLVPGMGHVLIGRPIRGFVAFAVTIGAFALGYSVLQDRLWHMQAVPLSGVFRYVPVLLLPEIANFGATVAVSFMREPDTHEILRRILLPRSGEDLAVMLTGFSGILSALWACDAWWLAGGRRAERIEPPVAAAVTWIIPGAGHVLAGQRSKGMLIGGAVLVVFALGLSFGAGESVDRSKFTLWWAGQAFCGIGTLTSTLLLSGKMTSYPAMLDLGYILCTIAGLMNIMVMTDAFAVAERGATDPAAAKRSAGAAT